MLISLFFHIDFRVSVLDEKYISALVFTFTVVSI